MNLDSIYFLNDIGEKKNQEDSIWPAPGEATPADRVFIVCDGVGGSENGEIASSLVSEFVGTAIQNNKEADLSASYINNLLGEAKQKLIQYASAHSLSADMATTFSLLVFTGEKVFLAWCGDSRVYHIRNGITKYKTADHSLVNSLVKSGQISEEDALSHPQRNIILKAIKADDAPVEVDSHWIDDVREDDYFMLCSDGLLENIGDKELKLLLGKNRSGDNSMIESFQRYCYGKTKDNYSMYLLGVGKTNRRLSLRKKINLLVLLLALLIMSSVVLIKKYDENKRKKTTPAQTNVFTDSADKVQKKDSLLPGETIVANEKDSLPYVEIIHDPKDSGKNPKPASLSTMNTYRDSIKIKKHLLLKGSDSARKIPDSAKKIIGPAEKKDSVKSDSILN